MGEEVDRKRKGKRPLLKPPEDHTQSPQSKCTSAAHRHKKHDQEPPQSSQLDAVEPARPSFDSLKTGNH